MLSSVSLDILVKVGAERVDFATGADGAVFGLDGGARVDLVEERFFPALGQRQEDSTPSRVYVEEQLGVLCGCR